jgi:hypothetical protein
MNSNKIKELNAYLLAVKKGNLEIMKYLEKEYNCDIHVKDNEGYDAYLLAAWTVT